MTSLRRLLSLPLWFDKLTTNGLGIRVFAAALLSCATSLAFADAIKLIVPTAPGGGTDGYFRVLAKGAEPYLKEPLVIVNVPGAGGTIGVAQMVRSAPDGQTLAAVWLGPVTVSPHTMKVPYTPNDYVPIIQLTSAPYVMCVHPDFPATEGKSFIEELRKNPDRYTYGDDGAGGPGQLATERIFRAMKVRARDIPFKGAGETLVAFLGHHIDIYVGSVPPVLQHAQAGNAKCVLLTSAERIAALPSASSLRDLGIPDEELILWRAVLAPKGTPPPKIAELEALFERAANAPATKKFLDDAGEQLLIRKGPALRQYIDKEYEALGKLAKALNLSPQ
ncbi:MAG: tripartite tricarboxylate transporter substrate binding protein [Betaproteobacteria bacterium]|nr:MAG: tripartite tricarboxylate transporter substrate binding protein [Betaproteobacteria bacterium]